MKKAVIFGFGMIGKLYYDLLKARNIKVFTYNSRSSADYNDITNIVDIPADIDFAIICSPTNNHLEQLELCAERKIPVIVEKPVTNDFTSFNNIINKYHESYFTKYTYLAYCLRFNPVIEYLKSKLTSKNPINVQIVNNNHLAAWQRQNLDSYSRYFERGGGVVLDLSHEIDFAYYIFNDLDIESFTTKKLGNFTIDAADYSQIIFSKKDILVEIRLNYHSHRAQREIIITFEDSSWVCDIKALKINVYKNRELTETIKFDGKYTDMYDKQLDYFIRNYGKIDLNNNLIEALKVAETLDKVNLKCD